MVWAVDQGFVIGGEERGVEDIMYLSMRRQRELIGNIRYYFCDDEGSVSAWLKLLVRVRYRKVRPFEPNLVPFLVWRESCTSPFSQQTLCMGGGFVSKPSEALNMSAPI